MTAGQLDSFSHAEVIISIDWQEQLWNSEKERLILGAESHKLDSEIELGEDPVTKSQKPLSHLWGKHSHRTHVRVVVCFFPFSCSLNQRFDLCGTWLIMHTSSSWKDLLLNLIFIVNGDYTPGKKNIYITYISAFTATLIFFIYKERAATEKKQSNIT